MVPSGPIRSIRRSPIEGWSDRSDADVEILDDARGGVTLMVDGDSRRAVVGEARRGRARAFAVGRSRRLGEHQWHRVTGMSCVSPPGQGEGAASRPAAHGTPARSRGEPGRRAGLDGARQRSSGQADDAGSETSGPSRPLSVPETVPAAPPSPALRTVSSSVERLSRLERAVAIGPRAGVARWSSHVVAPAPPSRIRLGRVGDDQREVLVRGRRRCRERRCRRRWSPSP